MRKRHRAVCLAHDDIDFGELRIGVRKVVARMAAATFLSLDRGQRRRFGKGQQRVEIQGRMPARIVLAIAFNFDVLRPLFQFVDYF